MEENKFGGDISEVDFDSSDILSPDNMGIASEVVVETCFEQQEQLENSANASEISVLQQSLVQEVPNDERNDSSAVLDDASQNVIVDEAFEDKNNPGNRDNDEGGEAVHADSSNSLQSLHTGKSFESLNHPASEGSILTHRMVTRSASRAVKSHSVEANKIPRKRKSSGGSSLSSGEATPTSSVRGAKRIKVPVARNRKLRKKLQFVHISGYVRMKRYQILPFPYLCSNISTGLPGTFTLLLYIILAVLVGYR